MLRSGRFFLAIFVLFFSQPLAFSGWNDIEWGATPQNAIKVLQDEKSAVTDVREMKAAQDEDSKSLFLLGKYASVYGPVEIQYKFENKKHLSRVRYAISSDKCNRVAKDFIRQYGAPMNDNYLVNSNGRTIISTRWYTLQDEIQLISMKFDKFIYCTITFQPL